MLSETDHSNRCWTPALTVTALCVLLVMVSYRDTAGSLYRLWLSSDTYAHGMLVAPIVLYMIWSRREDVAGLTPRASLTGLAALGAAGAVWLVAYTADVLVVQQFAFVAMLPALVYALLGRAVFAALSFPLLYLFFMVPVGEDLVEPMQWLTAEFTVEALQLSGIPVLLEGFFITLPSKSNPLDWDRFHVAEACSGVRYLIASVALGCLYAYLNYRSPWRRLAFIALSIALPIFANGLRAYGIVMLAHHSDMQLAIGVDHLIYGWVFFGLVIVLMFWIGSFWREPETTATASAATGPASAARPAFGRFAAVAAVALFVAALTPELAQRFHNGDYHRPVTLTAPPAPDGWQGPLPFPDVADRLGWSPRFRGSDATVRARYRWRGRDVYLYLAYYRQERQGAELINSQHRLYDPERWRRVGAGRRQLQARAPGAGADEPLTVNVAELDNYADGRLLYYWYQVAGRNVVSTLQAKLLRAWDQIGGVDKGSAVIAIATDIDALSPQRAEQLLARFSEQVLPALQVRLSRAGST